jgi:hypothetical protein
VNDGEDAEDRHLKGILLGISLFFGTFATFTFIAAIVFLVQYKSPFLFIFHTVIAALIWGFGFMLRRAIIGRKNSN